LAQQCWKQDPLAEVCILDIHSFVKGLFRYNPSNFYWNRFIFDEHGATDKLAPFFRHGVYHCI